MRQLLTICAFLALALSLGAQNDTTIYKIVDEAARFPGCESLDTTIDVKNLCSQRSLLLFFNQNINYPLPARDQNIEGTVALSFVVEKDGTISNIRVVKDIGGGCGEEALRVASGMNEALKQAKLAWTPGKMKGKTVRTQVNLPIKFKLTEPDDFVMVGRDSVWITVDDSLAYKPGLAAMEQFFAKQLKYPAQFKDSCIIGTMDMTLLARPDGSVLVLDLSDYWNLGNEFRWEAVKTATATWGQWQPATRKGRQVPSSVEITVKFSPAAGKCPQAVAKYDEAVKLAEAGSALYNEGKHEEGVAKLTEALALFPSNANFLYLRGQAYMNMDRMTEACEDFKKVRATVYLDVVEKLVPLICK
ncbi:MAG: TonB family protein [Saprospiraceae bacterium]|jgi:TonB family protein|nr:TonB family protein [Saprospiraceae bacterium]